MAENVAFRPVTVNGREIVFATPNAVQVALLHRLSKILGSASSAMAALDEQGVDRSDDRFTEPATRGIEAMGKTLDLFASLAAPDVADWLTDQMLTGKIDDDEVLRILQEIVPADDKPKGPRKSAKRVA